MDIFTIKEQKLPAKIEYVENNDNISSKNISQQKKE